MTYNEVIDWLFSQLPNYQKEGGSAYKPGLDIIKRLLHNLDNPHQKIKTVHVAGTNGKGSVSHILASVFIEHGYKTGLFTSPHIIDFRERVKIDGQPISQDVVTDFVEKNKNYWAEIEASFFEITTALAFYSFLKEKCEIAIIETGLGGRLDSTNVLIPEVSVITNVSLDHTSFLGNTIEEVASEKAGIIKKNVPVIIGEKQGNSYRVFEEMAKENASPLIYAKQDVALIETDLIGDYQQKNIRTALSTIKQLETLGWKFDKEKVLTAFRKVKSNTGLMGRMQKIGEAPDIIMDAAHNLHGLSVLKDEIQNLNFNRLLILYGSSNDKDVEEIFKNLPKEASYYFTSFESKRSLKKSELELLADSNHLSYSTYSSPQKALTEAKKMSNPDDLILIFGSFYLMEEILNS